MYAVCHKPRMFVEDPPDGEVWVAHMDAVKFYKPNGIKVVAKNLSQKEAKAIYKLMKGVDHGES